MIQKFGHMAPELDFEQFLLKLFDCTGSDLSWADKVRRLVLKIVSHRLQAIIPSGVADLMDENETRQACHSVPIQMAFVRIPFYLLKKLKSFNIPHLARASW